MNRDVSDWMEQLPKETDAQKLKASLSDLKRFAASEEGRRMVRALGETGGKNVQKAAEGLKKGDASSVKRLITYLQTTKEGQALAQKIKGITDKRGR
mgnify:FL=1